MKITMVMGKSSRSMGTFVSSLSQALREQGHEVSIIAEPTSAKRFRLNNVKPLWPVMPQKGYLLRSFWRRLWGVRAEFSQTDVIHAHGVCAAWFTLILNLLLARRVPILVSLYERHEKLRRGLGGYILQSWLLKRASLISGSIYAVAPGLATIFAWNRPLVGLEVAIVSLCPALWGYALLYHLSRVLVALDAPRYSFWAALVGWSVSAVAAWLLILCLAPQRGDSLATLVALGIGNSLGMTLAGIILLMVWRSFDRSGMLLVIRSVAIMVPGAILAAFAGRLAYGGVSSLSLPAPALWSCLVAGLVVVGICLPGLHWSTLAFQQLVSSARHDETPAASSENTDSSGEENPGGGEA